MFISQIDWAATTGVEMPITYHITIKGDKNIRIIGDLANYKQ